jgi:hypothetical protein
LRDDPQHRAIAILRLASARRRVHAFLNEISTLEASEFPHLDGEHALREIRAHFADLAKDMRGQERGPLKTIRGACLEVNLAIRRYTRILGFILRSTNVRNAFELHFPLKRLVTDVLGEQAKLIISSEWDFVPFTYPMNLDLLPNFVLVGGPAPESANALLTPLAGHEIGHSAWKSNGLSVRLRGSLDSEIRLALAEDPDLIALLNQQHGPDPQAAIIDTALKQLEEIFCDAFGLFIFGSAYAYAYEYLMYPGGHQRAISYPSDENRLKYLVRAARWYNLDLEKGPFELWPRSKKIGGSDGKVALIVDKAVSRLVQRAFEEASRILSDADVKPPDLKMVELIRGSFARDVPSQAGGTLAEIVNAGWLHLRKEGGLAQSQNALAKFRILNEVMLKSVEVSEYKRRVEGC